MRLFRRTVRVTVYKLPPDPDPTSGKVVAAVAVGALVDLQAQQFGAIVLSKDLLIKAAQSVVARGGSNKPYKPGNATSTAITDLRIQFKIEKSLTKTPNSCDITITNLAKGTRTDFNAKPLAVAIEGGYDDVYRQVFVGDVLFSMSEIKKSNWETLLQVGEGSRAYNSARVSRSYNKGTKIIDIVRDCANQMGFGLAKGIESDPNLQKALAIGDLAVGPVRDELDRRLAPYGYHWSLQGDRLQILSDTSSSTSRALVISESTGMIGTPEFGAPPRSGKPPHVKVKCLLYPEVTPGGLVKVISKALIGGQGLYRVEKVTHIGDTHSSSDSSWVTEIEIKPYTPIADQKVVDVITPAQIGSLKEVWARRAQEIVTTRR